MHQIFMLTSTGASDGLEKVVRLGFMHLSMAIDFIMVCFLLGINLDLVQVSVSVRHAEIKNKRLSCKCKSMKDISVLLLSECVGSIACTLVH